MKITSSVQDRYAEGAQTRQAELCCPVNYNAQYLKIIPSEVIERDYGCGDPSQYVRPGDVVLDLGSGGGKICFIASQVVGKEGKVIGVDMTNAHGHAMMSISNANISHRCPTAFPYLMCVCVCVCVFKRESVCVIFSRFTLEHRETELEREM